MLQQTQVKTVIPYFKNYKKNLDKDGLIASTGARNEIIYEQAQELYNNRKINKINHWYKWFDISFVSRSKFWGME